MKNICDLHTHCLLSKHAYSSLTENINAALALGLKYYGISDHQPDDVGVGAGRLAFDALEHVPDEINGLKILRGCEFNILEQGKIDSYGIKLARLNYGIASIHSYAYKGSKDKETVTQMYLTALDNPIIKILGHIDDGNYEADYEKIVAKAKELHKLIELNDSSLRPGTSRKNTIENDKEILRLSMKYHQPIIINSDAHISYAVGNHSLALDLINEVGFPKEMVLNFNEELFKEYFG